MDRTPLGGGAMVGLQLARYWAGCNGFSLTVLGSGDQPPAEGLEYLQFAARDPSLSLVSLSEMAYANFCRRFEDETTEFVLKNAKRFPPESTVIVINDISESPDVSRLSAAGYRIVSIWHVDVVDFFNRLYMGEVLGADRWARGFTRLERWGFGRFVPDVLRLVFSKQRQIVEHSEAIIVPSGRMRSTILRCYPAAGGLAGRVHVVPWGGWSEDVDERALSRETERLRRHYQLGPNTRVVLTLSRISPEKGIHYLVEAFSRLEGQASLRETDIALFIAGEAAFMRGVSYLRKVKALSERLKRFRVFFPGYLSGFDKQAYFRIADLFVSPSVHESYGLTIVEAMRAGLPVLASDHYGIDEILGKECGRKIPYGDPSRRSRRLAEALGEILPYSENLAEMGRAAREAAENMGFDRAAKRVADTALGLLREPVRTGI